MSRVKLLWREKKIVLIDGQLNGFDDGEILKLDDDGRERKSAAFRDDLDVHASDPSQVRFQVSVEITRASGNWIRAVELG